uniref:FHA domain-containing protein n=1 Tax=Parascaris univalens TaxID=6257 RepID=A0A915BLD6_PARUN
MSKNIPASSRIILEQSTNIARGIQTDSCDDPFDFRSATVEPCSSACLKVISCNRELRIVLRGCLTVIYPQIPTAQLKSHSEDFSQCDTQRQKNDDVGEIVTQTCLCTPSFCNSVSEIPHSITNFIVMFIAVLTSHVT